MVVITQNLIEIWDFFVGINKILELYKILQKFYKANPLHMLQFCREQKR